MHSLGGCGNFSISLFFSWDDQEVFIFFSLMLSSQDERSEKKHRFVISSDYGVGFDCDSEETVPAASKLLLLLYP